MGSNRRVPKTRIDDAYPSLDDALIAAEAITGLMAHPGWDQLQRFVNAEVESIDVQLDRGGDPPSRAEYAGAHGRRGGLLYVAHAAEAIVARADQRYREQKMKHEGTAGSVPEEVLT